MKKHWKKITLVLAAVLLSVGGYLVYVLQFKEYETADENVEKVTKEKIEIDLPDDTKLVVDEEGNVVEVKDGETAQVASEGSDAKGSEGMTGSAGSDEAAGTSSASDSKSGSGSAVAASNSNGSAGGSSSNGTSGSAGGEGSNDKAPSGSAASGNASAGSGSSGNGSTDKGTNGNGSSGNTGSNAGGSNGSAGNNGSAGSNGETARVTVADIKAKYQPTLSGLEADANAKIGGLINVAKNEYSQDSKDGKVSYPYYYNKYMGAATDLEKRMDSAFYAVVDVMKKDLKANGLAEAHTKSVVEEYEATKKQRRSELINKAAGL
ncbi:hypothetical protein QWY22_15155 [Planococcus liqunii]|uniref:hypothetical protein n=1 Tax=Planococcus liqunii TaxID=3058394 RepID=UPI002609E41E|nr:hypothetical protein [Planococcus sp. N056]WKA50227.1 hypothetical protein QWY22_15155 [Planococcus sp. N056]